MGGVASVCHSIRSHGYKTSHLNVNFGLGLCRVYLYSIQYVRRLICATYSHKQLTAIRLCECELMTFNSTDIVSEIICRLDEKTVFFPIPVPKAGSGGSGSIARQNFCAVRRQKRFNGLNRVK